MEEEERTMRSEIKAKPKIPKPSLTDSILQLCASGRFGVREAIAAATEQQQPPSCKALTNPAKEQESKSIQLS